MVKKIVVKNKPELQQQQNEMIVITPQNPSFMGVGKTLWEGFEVYIMLMVWGLIILGGLLLVVFIVSLFN